LRPLTPVALDVGSNAVGAGGCCAGENLAQLLFFGRGDLPVADGLYVGLPSVSANGRVW
jgi:hypothetical protein